MARLRKDENRRPIRKGGPSEFVDPALDDWLTDGEWVALARAGAWPPNMRDEPAAAGVYFLAEYRSLYRYREARKAYLVRNPDAVLPEAFQLRPRDPALFNRRLIKIRSGRR